MTFRDIERRLTRALSRPLPGAAAQLVMAPRPRSPWPQGGRPDQPRSAAGLLLVYAGDTDAHCVLTVRADTLLHHAGQVSLPGGTIDPGETVEEAALREAHEEIGLEPAGLSVLGRLTPLDVPVSGFTLHPVVASAPQRPPLRPAASEVSRILDVPLSALCDPAKLRLGTRSRDGRRFEAPGFDVHGVEVWGVTAMVLAELLAVLGHTPDPWRIGSSGLLSPSEPVPEEP